MVIKNFDSIQLYLQDEILKDLSVQEVINLIAEVTSNKFEEIDQKVDYDLLINEAKTFLSALYTLETQKELFKQNTLKYLALRKDPYATEETLTKEERFEQGILQQEYQLALHFEKFLDNWRGKKKERIGVYVDIDSDTGMPSSYEIPMTEMVDYANKEGGLSLSFKRLTKNDRSSIEDSGLIPKARIELARKAYEGVYNRVEQYYKAAGITDRKKSAGILLWKDGSIWEAAKVLNYGDLGEAYISFLLDKRSNALTGIPAGRAPYRSHELIKNFYYNYIYNVTNMSAIIQEDVITKDKELAVKTIGSNLPSFQQYVDAALLIVRDSTFAKSKRYTKKEFEEELKRKFPQDAERNLKATINSKVKKALIEKFS